MDRRDVGGWLLRPGASYRPAEPTPEDGEDGESRRPGARLGLPSAGRGALASLSRRALALAIDWGLALLVANALVGDALGPFAPLLVLLIMNLVLVGTAGMTPGQLLLRLRVQTLDGAPPGLRRALIRSLLLILVIPALLTDADHRGLHDRLAGTVVVNR